MHKLPLRQDVLALEQAVEHFFKEIRRTDRAVRLQPNLKLLLSQTSAVFDTGSIEGLVEITSISKEKLKRVLDGYSIKKDTARLLLRNVLAACEVYLTGGVFETTLPVGSGWVSVPLSARSKAKELQTLLGNLLDLVQGSNQGEDACALSVLEREELVAILETALLHLKAPLVHKPFIKGLGGSLKRIAARVAERQVELALGAAAGSAATATLTFLTMYLK
jgi:hypothetical protein